MAFGTGESSNSKLVVNAEIVQSAGWAEHITPVAMPLHSLGGAPSASPGDVLRMLGAQIGSLLRLGRPSGPRRLTLDWRLR